MRMELVSTLSSASDLNFHVYFETERLIVRQYNLDK